MKQNNLGPKGLSMSQAASISNILTQRVQSILRDLSVCNNASKSVTIDGKQYTTVVGKPLPEDVVDKLKLIASYNACVAFLRENMKAKEESIESLRKSVPTIEGLEDVKPLELVKPKVIKAVSEDFGWSCLTPTELNEFYEAEAYASTLGGFFHKDQKLDLLRKYLPSIPAIEWQEIDKDRQTPIEIKVHHTQVQLDELHETLANLHRDYEKRVNYYKAKVKNLTTIENARIAKENAEAARIADAENAKAREEYRMNLQVYSEKHEAICNEYEMARVNSIGIVAQSKIEVDKRFQAVIDTILPALTE